MVTKKIPTKRSLMQTLLFGGMDWTDRHQKLMLAGAIACLLLVAFIAD